MKVDVKMSFKTEEFMKSFIEFQEKAEDYMERRDALREEDDILGKVRLEQLSDERPEEPSMPEYICRLNIDNKLIQGYLVIPPIDGIGSEIKIFMDKRKHNHPFYITNYDDKIIQELDRIIEEN